MEMGSMGYIERSIRAYMRCRVIDIYISKYEWRMDPGGRRAKEKAKKIMYHVICVVSYTTLHALQVHKTAYPSSPGYSVQ